MRLKQRTKRPTTERVESSKPFEESSVSKQYAAFLRFCNNFLPGIFLLSTLNLN